MASRLKEAFERYMRTFLAHRRELQGDLSDQRVNEIRDEYRTLQRAVVAAYRPVRDLFHGFIEEEPGFDQRNQMFDDGIGDIPLEYPLTSWWRPLTFDEARANWANADDDHIEQHLQRMLAVLEAFEDWARVERPVAAQPQQEPVPKRSEHPIVTASRMQREKPGRINAALNHGWTITIVGTTIGGLMVAGVIYLIVRYH